MLTYAEAADIDAIRAATRGRGVLGSEHFRREAEHTLQRTLVPNAHGGDRRSKQALSRTMQRSQERAWVLLDSTESIKRSCPA